MGKGKILDSSLQNYNMFYQALAACVRACVYVQHVMSFWHTQMQKKISNSARIKKSGGKVELNCHGNDTTYDLHRLVLYVINLSLYSSPYNGSCTGMEPEGLL